MDIILLVVVITTAIFLYVKIRNTQNELRETQQLFLQFIDHFEEQLAELSKQHSNVQGTVNEYEKLNREPNSNEPIEEMNNTPVIFDDPLSLKMRYAEIIDRMKEGKSIEEIAKEIGKGTGEVQLIVELLEAKKQGKTFLDNDH